MRFMKKRSLLNRQSVKGKRKREGKKNVFAVYNVIHWFGSGFLKLFILVAVVAMISLSFLYLYHYLLTSPYMKLERVEVKGVDGEIRHDLIQACGLNPDMSLLALRLNELKQKMENHPWVRSVKLERRFPHTLIVRAEKEIPSALVVMDKICYMNRYGEVFKEVCESEEMDFPVITGASEQGSEVSEQLDRAAQIMGILEFEEGLWSLNELSEIHIKKDGGMSLYFNHLAAEIKLMCDQPGIERPQPGMAGDLASKMETLKEVAGHLIKTGRIHQVTGIDLNHVDGAVVSFRKG